MNAIRIAVLGLGEAGSAITADLLAAGARVRGYDPAVTAPPGVTDTGSEAEAVRGSELVLSVNSSAASIDALRGGLDGAAPGTIWADLNTALPRQETTARRDRRRARHRLRRRLPHDPGARQRPPHADAHLGHGRPRVRRAADAARRPRRRARRPRRARRRTQAPAQRLLQGPGRRRGRGPGGGPGRRLRGLAARQHRRRARRAPTPTPSIAWSRAAAATPYAGPTRCGPPPTC